MLRSYLAKKFLIHISPFVLPKVASDAEYLAWTFWNTSFLLFLDPSGELAYKISNHRGRKDVFVAIFLLLHFHPLPNPHGSLSSCHLITSFDRWFNFAVADVVYDDHHSKTIKTELVVCMNYKWALIYSIVH